MLGAGTTGFATPVAIGYALHVRRRGTSPLLGRVAFVIAVLEVFVCLTLAVSWLWNALS